MRILYIPDFPVCAATSKPPAQLVDICRRCHPEGTLRARGVGIAGTLVFVHMVFARCMLRTVVRCSLLGCIAHSAFGRQPSVLDESLRGRLGLSIRRALLDTPECRTGHTVAAHFRQRGHRLHRHGGRGSQMLLAGPYHRHPLPSSEQMQAVVYRHPLPSCVQIVAPYRQPLQVAVQYPWPLVENMACKASHSRCCSRRPCGLPGRIVGIRCRDRFAIRRRRIQDNVG